LFTLYYYLPFLDEKKALYDRFAFNSNSPWIEHIKKYKTQKKIIDQSASGPQINQRRSQNIFGIL
jgi:hypothetical protein